VVLLPDRVVARLHGARDRLPEVDVHALDPDLAFLDAGQVE
jgi:hypothetical protein